MIHIFFGSSILNEHTDKESIELFIRKLNVEFSNVNKLIDINIKPLFKNELNVVEDLIKKSDYTFFIIFKNVSFDETDEIVSAVESFEVNNKPKVYVYFKNILDTENVEDSILKLQEKIANEFSHYYKTFDNIDEIKLRLIENVFSDKLKNSLVLEDNKVKFEGIDLSQYVDYKILPEFKNNKELQDIKAEYDQLLIEYNNAIKEASDKDYFSLEEIYAKKEVLKEQIKDKENKIFNLSIKLIELKNQDLKNGNIEKALMLFEEGDIRGSIDALNLNNTNRRIKDARLLKEKVDFDLDKVKYEAKWAIKEKRIVIDLLLETNNVENVDNMVLELYYQNALDAIEFEVELDEAFGYVEFALGLSQSEKANEVLDLLAELIEDKSERKYPILYAKLYNLYGLVSMLSDDDLNETNNYFLDALNYYKIKVEDSDIVDEESLLSMVKLYVKISETYYHMGKINDSIDFTNETINLCEALSKINFGKYSKEIAKIYTILLTQSTFNENEKFEEFYKKNLEYHRSLNIDGKNNNLLIESLIGLGNFYFFHGTYSDALKYFLEVEEIYNNFNYISSNSQRITLSTLYNQMAVIMHSENKYDEMIKYQEKAYEQSLIAFRENPLTVDNYMTIILNLISFYNMFSPSKAEPLLEECSNLLNELYKKYKSKAIESIILIYSNISLLYLESSNIDKAIYYNQKYINLLVDEIHGDFNYYSYNLFFGIYSHIYLNLSIFNYEEALEYLYVINDIINNNMSNNGDYINQLFQNIAYLAITLNNNLMDIQNVLMTNSKYQKDFETFFELYQKLITKVTTKNNVKKDTNDLINTLLQNSEFYDQKDVIKKCREVIDTAYNDIVKSKFDDNVPLDKIYQVKIKNYFNFIASNVSLMAVVGIDPSKYLNEAMNIVIECNFEYPSVVVDEAAPLYGYYYDATGVRRYNVEALEIYKKYLDSEIYKFENGSRKIPYLSKVLTTSYKVLEDLSMISGEKENVLGYYEKLVKIFDYINSVSSKNDRLKEHVGLYKLEMALYPDSEEEINYKIFDLLHDYMSNSKDDELIKYYCTAANDIMTSCYGDEDNTFKYFNKISELFDHFKDVINQNNSSEIITLISSISESVNFFDEEKAKEVSELYEELSGLYEDFNLEDFMQDLSDLDDEDF